MSFLERLIRPAPIIYNRTGIKAKNLLFDDIFTGSHHFFLKVHGHDWILGGGLNNFNQLGLTVDEPVYFPTFIPSLEGKKWTKFSGGLHHTIGLTADGKNQNNSLIKTFFSLFKVKFMQSVDTMKVNWV
jgi:hypothetical protein